MSDSKARPFVRLFARYVDYSLIALVPISIFGYKCVSKFGKPWIFGMLIIFLWVFVEAVLLATFGTTPGKWLLRITIQDSEGQKLTFSKAFKRSLLVWIKGMGIGIPMISAITVIVAYSNLVKDNITSWDSEGGIVVSHSKIGMLRVTATTIFLLGYVLVCVYGRIVEILGGIFNP